MSFDNLELLRALEAYDAVARRRAVWIAWTSVFLAAIILTSFMLFAYSNLTKMKALANKENNRVIQLRKERMRLTILTTQLNAEVERLKPLVENYRITAAGESEQLSRQTQRSASDNLLKPLVYLHIVNSGDRDYAKEIGRRLDKAGFLVLGIETVLRAASLKNTEVRYYKKADEQGAIRLLAALKEAGAKSAVLLYLGLEKSTKVRPNSYEIWFAAGAGQPSTP